MTHSKPVLSQRPPEHKYYLSQFSLLTVLFSLTGVSGVDDDVSITQGSKYFVVQVPAVGRNINTGLCSSSVPPLTE